MANLDLKKELKHLYNPSAKAPGFVTIPRMSYLMIDGAGDPNTSQQYADAVSSLYALSYGIRAISKAAGTVYTVMPLEGLWWWENMEEHADFTITAQDKADFLWTMMILQPEHINAAMVAEATETVRKKKNPPLLGAIRFEAFDEGKAAQIMHIGSYADEPPTIRRLHEYIDANGYALTGKHHEIYLSDPRKVDAEKLKTIIRQPVQKG